MATQTAHAHAGHAHSSSTSSYPPRPASPTLTNPDMILPDYDRSPSPERSHSPLTMWKNAHAADMNMQFQFPPSAFVAGPVTPTTPIIYGNGTMLSDIGEVTEAESTPGKASRPNSIIWSRPNNGGADEPRYPSPTKVLESLKQRAARATRERRFSIDSTSTITTTQDQNAIFAGFDDSMSVDDSNFQGDDEESVAESYVEQAPVHQTQEMLQPTRSPLDDTDRYSTSLISRRAEQILANAKRRLTTMEGNLSRARGSLSISTPSMSSFDGNHSTPSPPRSASSVTSPMSAHGHARMLSDTSLNIDGNTMGNVPKRSASAMGAAGGYRQPHVVRKASYDSVSDRLNSGGEGHSRYKLAQEIGLEPLGEDEATQDFHSGSDGANREGLLSPAFSSTTRDRPLTRSASVAQMRDIRGQVQDLKGKISSLREQARADSMQRRSMQSLRTPSPFTHARVDPWYAEAQKTQSPEPASSEKNPLNADRESVDGLVKEQEEGSEAIQPSVADNGSAPEDYDAVEDTVRQEERQKALNAMEANQNEEHEAVENDDISDMETEDGFEDSVQIQGGEGYDSDSGDSLYHDTVQTFMSHEDREDAFDYEHFFLHSAMGTLSQNRRGSVTSESSIETTRGPTISNEPVQPIAHNRRGSGDTTSTMESFATAHDGRSSRVSDTGEELRHGILTPPSISPISERTESPPTAKRGIDGSNMGGEDALDKLRSRARAGSIAFRRPMTTQATLGHRPGTASFDSTGTNRSFPLVGKARVNVGVLTPQGSPDLELRTISDALMSETASICDKESMHTPDQPAPMEQLAKEDQILVERFVASLGRCVLGMSEAGKASAETRMYRRRIDMARRILEGIGESS
ncbi:hypothetical protein LX36DRAFT_677175 [Colletotrichum falcatum]|nr:hypothetical protein LX36DRAFT_677175 [Colletotrichum falcatum]